MAAKCKICGEETIVTAIEQIECGRNSKKFWDNFICPRCMFEGKSYTEEVSIIWICPRCNAEIIMYRDPFLMTNKSLLDMTPNELLGKKCWNCGLDMDDGEWFE